MHSSRTLKKILHFFAATTFIALSTTPQTSIAKEVVSVVVLGDFSASGTITDREIWDGFSLGIKHLATQGDLFSVKVVTRDIKGSDKTAKSIATEVLGKGSTDFIIGLSQAAIEGAMEPAFAAEKTLLAASGSPPSLVEKDCSRFFFSLAPPASGTHEIMGTFLEQIPRSRTFFVAADTKDSWLALSSFRRGYKGTVVGEALIPPHRMSHSLDISKIRAAGSDSAYLILSGGLATTFVRQYVDSGQIGDAPLFGSWSTFEPPLLMAIGDRALGARSVGFWSNDIENKINMEFLSEFETEYNRLHSTFSALGYDTALLIGALATRLGPQIHETDAIRTALRRFPVPTTRGDLRFAINHFPLTTFYLRHVVKDARGRYLNEIEYPLTKDWRDAQISSCPMKWTPAKP